jgi:hypothetical protein
MLEQITRPTDPRRKRRSQKHMRFNCPYFMGENVRGAKSPPAITIHDVLNFSCSIKNPVKRAVSRKAKEGTSQWPSVRGYLIQAAHFLIHPEEVL